MYIIPTRTSDFYRFPIAEKLKRWTLSEALFRKVRKSELCEERTDQCELGELFKKPLIFLTPRNNVQKVNDVKNKYNDLVQVTIVGNRIQES